jgi:hypothetical protein
MQGGFSPPCFFLFSYNTAMWKNKHVVVALLVAPILSILAWYAIGNIYGEKPQVAEEGKTYKLVGRSNCRYASGSCTLHNADFELTLETEMLAASSVALTMTASHGLQSAALGLVEGDSAPQPAPMTQTSDDGTGWQGLLPRPSSPDAVIRVAVTAQGAAWYAEVSSVFLETEE